MLLQISVSGTSHFVILRQKMQKTRRVLSIDIMRGITLFLMLFVNDLYSPGVPDWLTHKPADFDGMGLADWVFPGFLFVVGMSVPFAIQNRLKKGNKSSQILIHILVRTISLLVIGVLMLNISRINPDLTGIKKSLWAMLVYISIFLVWNNYRTMDSKIVYALKGLGLIGLLILMLIYKAGSPEEVTWLRTGWWGILGLIGWGYFVTSLVYMAVKDNMLGIILFWLLFIVLNVLSELGLLNFLNFAKPVFGVIISGNTPSIVMAGLFFGVLLKKNQNYAPKRFLIQGLLTGVFLLIAGFVLRQWFIISKLQGTPSWAMLCNGISVLLFVLLYVLIDVLYIKKWAGIFKPAGQNALTTYLAPDILYYTIWLFEWRVLIYKESENVLIVIAGSLLWAFLMIGFAALLSKIGIRLKL